MFPALLAAILSIGPTHADGATTLNVTAEASAFLAGTQIHISLLDAEQMKRLKNNERCMVSWDGRSETVHCLEGTTYQPVEAETFSFSQDDLSAPLRIASATVSRGERFQIHISGTAPDDCNTSNGTFKGTARGASTDITIAEIYTTAMACID